MAEDIKNLQEEIELLKKKLSDKDWAGRKTSEGIKILYRELEKKNEELLTANDKLEILAEHNMKAFDEFLKNISEYREEATYLHNEVNELLQKLGKPTKYTKSNGVK